MQVILKIFSFLLFACFSFTTTHGQSITDMELGRLADSLVRKVKLQMTGQNIAIAEFVDINGNTTDLGKYLSEEFTYTLSNKAGNYNIIDRSHLRTLLDEAGIGDIGMVNPQSAQKLGRIEGVTAIVYGKLASMGNEITVFINVVNLEKQVNAISVRGKITRTVTIDKLYRADLEKNKEATTVDNKSAEGGQSTQSFAHKNINVVLSQCIRKDGGVYCEFKVTSQNIADNFFIKSKDTNMELNGDRTYYPTQLGMNGQRSSIQVNQSLQKNVASIFSIWFANVPNNSNSIREIQLNCNTSAAFSFKPIFRNINIK